MTDPRHEKELDLLALALAHAVTDEDVDAVQDIQAELEEVQMDSLPEPGKFRIILGGTARKVPPVTFTCPDCGVTKTTKGGGVAFFEPGEHGLTDEGMALASHQTYNCPARKWRWYRYRWGLSDARGAKVAERITRFWDRHHGQTRQVHKSMKKESEEGVSSWATSAVEELAKGFSVKMRPKGNSMDPLIRSGDLVTIEPVFYPPKVGDIVLCRVKGRYWLHKVLATRSDGACLIGNQRRHVNGWARSDKIYGIVVEVVH